MLNAESVTVERRKHKRVKVGGGVFAILGEDSRAMGRIIDISKGGLAFNYNGSGIESLDVSELSLLFADENTTNISHSLLKFKSRLVSDQATRINGRLNPLKRRCAVQFDDDMTWYQHSSLDNLIFFKAQIIS